jgi:hypothetical protein
MGKITRDQVKFLDGIGEEELFERITAGHTVRSIIRDLQIGNRAWYKWLAADPTRKERYEQTKEAAAHFYASRAIETAQDATPESVNVARLQVDTDKWIAAKYSPSTYGDKKQVDVTMSVEDLHAQAAALVSQEVVELTSDDYDVDEDEAD